MNWLVSLNIPIETEFMGIENLHSQSQHEIIKATQTCARLAGVP
jgi:hypothetical protein